MAWLATAVIASTVVGAGSSILSTKAQIAAAKSGADATTAAANEASAVQMQMFKQQREDLLPWIETGQKAQGTLADLMGIDTGGERSDKFGSLADPFSQDDFYQDPGYAFRKQEGEAGINRMASASGGFFSGQRAKALNKYNQDYASQEYQNAFNRNRAEKGDLYNRLSGISSQGQGGAGTSGTAGINTAANIGNNAIWAGGQQADAYQRQANATSAGYQNISNIANQGVANWMYLKK